MPLFRCLICPDAGDENKRLEFEAAKGVCPACKADGDHVVPLATIHFDPPSGRPGRGVRHAACDKRVTIGRPGGQHMTGEPAAVTCRACMKTPVWQLEAEIRGVPAVPAEQDFEVKSPDPQTGN